jgi:putative transposase
MFNLPPPPGFRGLDEHLPVTVYQRHLPHWRQEGATYFVTFRLADALPQSVVHQLLEFRRTWEVNHSQSSGEKDWEALVREIVRRTEITLDQSYGVCHFRNPVFAQLLADALVHFNGQRHDTTCYVVMPNHCHAIIRPYPDHALEKILQTIKGYVAREINKAIGRMTSEVWQEESFDRIIRDEEHLYQVMQYIGRNPSMAGIPREQWVRWIDPAWRAEGWIFEDEMEAEKGRTGMSVLRKTEDA